MPANRLVALIRPPRFPPCNVVYEPDGIVAFADGVITHFGAAQNIEPQLPPGLAIRKYGPDALISAGFLDSHVHYTDTQAEN